MTNTKFRYATVYDAKKILFFINKLAKHQNLEHEVKTDIESIKEWIFKRHSAEVIFALEDGKEVGFAMFYHTYSTFLGRADLHLEDIFVLDEYRRKGYGKAMLKKLAGIAKERNCDRLEWKCLKWNKPSIDFYLSMGAVPQDEWRTFRLTGEKLQNF